MLTVSQYHTGLTVYGHGRDGQPDHKWSRQAQTINGLMGRDAGLIVNHRPDRKRSGQGRTMNGQAEGDKPDVTGPGKSLSNILPRAFADS